MLTATLRNAPAPTLKALPRLLPALLLLAVANPTVAEPIRQRSADPYTRYELESPGSAKFRIVYDVTATASGATKYYNPIRVGSEPTVHSVTDLLTGKPLKWKLIDGKEAVAHLEGANLQGQYIEVTLARPVPKDGEARIRIDKTYADPVSYTSSKQGGLQTLVFERSLGIPRNAIVLPPGFELTKSTMPVQVAREASGRIKLSFLHRAPGPALLRVEARALTTPNGVRTQVDAAALIEQRPPTQRTQAGSARLASQANERAFQDREIVYFLQPPETHAFRLFHDYTESREGMDRYLNVVRPGSRASDPSASILDTGEELKVETLRGKQITERGLKIGEPITDNTEVVVIWYEAITKGSSKRLRIWETYTDAGRYGINPQVKDATELVWDRSFGRSRNTVVLPPGWWLTESSIPARIDLDDEGRVRLLFENDRPDVIDVLLRARMRAPRTP